MPDSTLNHGGTAVGQRRIEVQLSAVYDGSSNSGILSVNRNLEEGASQFVEKV